MCPQTGPTLPPLGISQLWSPSPTPWMACFSLAKEHAARCLMNGIRSTSVTCDRRYVVGNGHKQGLHRYRAGQMMHVASYAWLRFVPWLTAWPAQLSAPVPVSSRSHQNAGQPQPIFRRSGWTSWVPEGSSCSECGYRPPLTRRPSVGRSHLQTRCRRMSRRSSMVACSMNRHGGHAALGLVLRLSAMTDHC